MVCKGDESVGAAVDCRGHVRLQGRFGRSAVIKVYVNGAEYDASSTERFTVATGERISYSFEVFAHTGIATVKEIRYQVLSDEVKVPTERLVAGLPDDLNVTVSGTIDAKDDTEIRLVVEDWDHNEVSNGFTFYVQ